MLVRNHLLCPYKDCIAHRRQDSNRVQALIDEKRNVILNKALISKVKRTKLPYLNKKWIILGKCPYCNRGLEVVIDETHNGRNIHLKLP